MNYKEATDYIYSKLPMFSRIGTEAIKVGLRNIRQLTEALGNPHEGKKFIHVAGTNGKGSVSHMLAAMLQSAGYKTGLYTSPHLTDIRERVKINGEMMSEADLIAFIEKTKPLIETTRPSFFEINVAMAFYHFAKNNTDIAVIETGLGGRLDSTNIITPLLSVITNIGYDHVKILGETLPEIALQKAGIIKENTPVVIGQYQPETAPVFENTASEKNAPLTYASKTIQLQSWEYEGDFLKINTQNAHENDGKTYLLDLSANYQTRNAITALAAIHALNKQGGFLVPEKAIAAGLQHTKKLTGLHGRWETIHHQPKIILDVGHNTDGIQQILHQLEITTYRHLHIILGMVSDKDVEAVLALLPKQAGYYFTNAAVPRAMPKEILQEKAAAQQLHGAVYDNVNAAINAALEKAQKEDLLLVCGSVFLVGETDLKKIAI